MEFTKEQIETGKQLIESYKNRPVIKMDFENYLDSLLKPERKKIIVEIECKNPKEFPLDEHSIRCILNCGCSETGLNWKVKELPEVFTREDLDELVTYTNFHGGTADDWLLKRKQK